MKKILTTCFLIAFACLLNAQPRLVRMLGQQYGNSVWQDSAEEEYYYDSTGRKSEVISGGPNIATGIYQKTVFSYNSSGQILQLNMYDWDDATSDWETTSSGTVNYYYNSSGKLEKTASEWFTDSLVYNSNGQVIEQFYIDKGINPVNISKDVNTYNSSGELIETIYKKLENTIWVNWTKDERTYNSSGKITVLNNYFWDKDSSLWDFSYQTTYSYNNGVLAEELDESVSFGSSKTIYTYNTDGTLKEELSQDLYGSTWVDVDRILYFYDNTSGISSSSNENINIYPNPSAGKFTLDFNFDETPAQIQVWDITGKQVFNQPINSGTTAEINLQSLDKGIYLLHLTTLAGTETQKLVIE